MEHPFLMFLDHTQRRSTVGRIVFKRQVINLGSCCIWLVDSVESMMMHGLANPEDTLYCIHLLSIHYVSV